MDTGFPVIDTTIVFDEASKKYFRFSKDERANSASNPNGKFVFQEVSASLAGPWKMVKAGIGKGVVKQGEGPTVFKSNTVANKVCLLRFARVWKEDLLIRSSGTCSLTSLEIVDMSLSRRRTLLLQTGKRPAVMLFQNDLDMVP